MSEVKKTEHYALRLTPDMMDFIKSEAEANYRPIISQITMMLEMAQREIESAEA